MGKKVIRLTEKDIESLVGKIMSEASVSKDQQRAAGIALSAKRGETPVSELRGSAKEMYDSMTEKQLEDFASTKHKGLPEKVNEDLPRRERERKATNFRRDTFDPYQREGQIMDIFGPYKNDVPPNVISYMRKNPALIIKRLEQVYGRDKILRYLGINE
jgi:hypothetical protein